jgi:hypothetical protein
VMERANRTLGEALEGEELTDYLQATSAFKPLSCAYCLVCVEREGER